MLGGRGDGGTGASPLAVPPAGPTADGRPEPGPGVTDGGAVSRLPTLGWPGEPGALLELGGRGAGVGAVIGIGCCATAEAAMATEKPSERIGKFHARIKKCPLQKSLQLLLCVSSEARSPSRPGAHT